MWQAANTFMFSLRVRVLKDEQASNKVVLLKMFNHSSVAFFWMFDDV